MIPSTDMSARPVAVPRGQDQLEERVIAALSAGCQDQPYGAAFAERLNSARKTARQLSGVGFFTSYEVDQTGPPEGCSNPMATNIVLHLEGWGTEEGISDGLFGGAVYFFGRKDSTDTLEGFTYGSVPWPDDVTSVSIKGGEIAR